MDASNKIQSYVEKLKVLNKISGEVYSLSHDFMRDYKNQYLWYNFVSTYLQKDAVKANKRAVFITLTLPSEYHPYTTLKNEKKIVNKNYNDSLNGYKLLNDSFRHLYNHFQVGRKILKVKYLKVIEPHKDFTPHLHAIIFLSSEELDSFKNHFNNVLKTFCLGVQHDFTILDSVQASVSYIMKYVKKSVFTDDISTARIIDGWKKDRKIRMFTHSQIETKRYFFSIISRYIDLTLDSKDYSIIENLQNKVSVNIKYYEDALCYRNDLLFNSHSNIKVYISKKKTNRKKVLEHIYVAELFNHWTRFMDFFKELDKLEFDYIDLVRYFYQFYPDNEELYYISKDFDYISFFMRMDFHEFLELFKNYLFDNMFDNNISYTITDFIIIQDDKVLYDMKNYELI